MRNPIFTICNSSKFREIYALKTGEVWRCLVKTKHSGSYPIAMKALSSSTEQRSAAETFWSAPTPPSPLSVSDRLFRGNSSDIPATYIPMLGSSHLNCNDVCQRRKATN
ncbi:hypothetical protein J6590_090532 [Homalodisca vitripennis]|nr:hypothetical protein J6590_090532 [Homalodisca vitripennis]